MSKTRVGQFVAYWEIFKKVTRYYCSILDIYVCFLGIFFANTMAMGLEKCLFIFIVFLNISAWGEISVRKIASPFFYKYSKGTKVNYLLGTVHAGVRVEELPNEILVQLKSSKFVVFESDTESAREDKEFESNAERFSKLPKGVSAENFLTPQGQKKLKELFSEDSYKYELPHLQPWVIRYLLIEVGKSRLKREGSLADLEYKNGIDSKLLAISKANNLPVEYLEDYKDKPMEWVNEFTFEDLEKLLKYPDPVGHILTCFQMAITGYRFGDWNLLKRYQKNCNTERERNSNDQRSKLWQPKLMELSNKGGGFIVVGSAHLIGNNGIIEFLTEQGYTVEGVEFYKKDRIEKALEPLKHVKRYSDRNFHMDIIEKYTLEREIKKQREIEKSFNEWNERRIERLKDSDDYLYRWSEAKKK